MLCTSDGLECWRGAGGGGQLSIVLKIGVLCCLLYVRCHTLGDHSTVAHCTKISAIIVISTDTFTDTGTDTID